MPGCAEEISARMQAAQGLRATSALYESPHQHLKREKEEERD